MYLQWIFVMYKNETKHLSIYNITQCFWVGVYQHNISCLGEIWPLFFTKTPPNLSVWEGISGTQPYDQPNGIQ